MPAEPVAVILGSSFSRKPPESLELVPETVETPFGPFTVHQVNGLERPACVSFRHGLPYRLLPHQIPYRAQAFALHRMGCRALLSTSAVGVLDGSLPLFEPLLVNDIVMLENRLPDGQACTIFTEPSPDQGHLVLDEGLISHALTEELRTMATANGFAPAADVVFGYAGGPRTKTHAENAAWAGLGVQVNSMTLAPELVLANELGIPCAGLVVGHKYSLPERSDPVDESAIDVSLARARSAIETVTERFLRESTPARFGNRLHRLAQDE